jgi:hypothetical protein
MHRASESEGIHANSVTRALLNLDSSSITLKAPPQEPDFAYECLAIQQLRRCRLVTLCHGSGVVDCAGSQTVCLQLATLCKAVRHRGPAAQTQAPEVSQRPRHTFPQVLDCTCVSNALGVAEKAGSSKVEVSFHGRENPSSPSMQE